ncbi:MULTISPECIES: 5-formyltetrahydrofolate cyclo-ligase [unclassified Rhizobium]|uniref:5-formyltetrahydrofolate cyclo-ligase n=1 Tax=unclassified Rhizobium TaxID=2613769 RepID=UPI001ADA5F72|nr:MULTISPECIES: 5-formyltetrahydrofolate cyclo-ligase [unclassified Rhizobium]MBO9099374.1 5-formyltetrahydrofolate cyclo-ligase [Rhizobium sp. L58/93]MBO9131820.1 5-formyltetrahydrofolate cyclo-ligase [Rhizobium sp. B209b/85]MBO9169638.1 5-formyltetrahydrofolate cyclo-ligase [Rhizobium sp. L245/93]MBO9185587.1 5-formyltetrahydrofolate cyclo-ligase [Rhizobium sp. E27B/91]QXZ82342.1 5-formyltetrahydrofolate cyclo-ligase [Rhizobium sp. K1/93]
MASSEMKAQLRKERLAARDALPADLRAQKSATMVRCGDAEIRFEPGAVIAGFLPIRSEADIRPLLDLLRSRGARVCLPVVVDRETIVFRELADARSLVPGAFGTLGPDETAALLEPDILLVPLSAFDAAGRRIGYGGGYYDRAIALLRRKGLARRLIGIAFDCQEVPSVPAEPHDVPLDAILTESGLRIF